MEELELYVVRNKDGMYLRAKGYNGSGNSWVKDLKDAKIYPKISNARRQVTFWANHYPKYGVPEILVLTVTATTVLKEDDRIKKAIVKREREKLSNELYCAKKKLEKANDEVTRLTDKRALLLANQCADKAAANVRTLEEKLKSL